MRLPVYMRKKSLHMKARHSCAYTGVCVVLGGVVVCMVLLQSHLLHYSETLDAFVQCRHAVQCVHSPNQMHCVQKKSEQSKQSPPKYALASLLVVVPGEPVESYIRHSSVHAYSARSTGKLPCSVDLVLLTVGDLSISQRTRLQRAGWNVLVVPTITPPGLVMKSLQITHRWYHMFTKLHFFNMTAYDAVLYMDSDMLVMGDIADMIPYYHKQMTLHDVPLAWVMDPYIDDTHNSGVMLIRPSTELTNDMMHAAHTRTFIGNWGDQGFINMYFKNNTVDIPLKYNAMPFFWNHIFKNQPYIWLLENDIRILHFTFIKPKHHYAWETLCWWKGVTHLCRKWSMAYERVQLLQAKSI